MINAVSLFTHKGQEKETRLEPETWSIHKKRGTCKKSNETPTNDGKRNSLMEKEFIELVNNNRALVFKVCNLYCHDHESRRDLFQEVVLQLWKSYPNFRKDAAGSTWIYRVALNTAISNFRKESKKPEKTSITPSEFDIPDMSARDEKENSSALHLAIGRLTQIEKAIILLYLEEKSYDEISEIIGISISNVGVRLNRIKNKLSKLIKTVL